MRDFDNPEDPRNLNQDDMGMSFWYTNQDSLIADEAFPVEAYHQSSWRFDMEIYETLSLNPDTLVSGDTVVTLHPPAGVTDDMGRSYTAETPMSTEDSENEPDVADESDWTQYEPDGGLRYRVWRNDSNVGNVNAWMTGTTPDGIWSLQVDGVVRENYFAADRPPVNAEGIFTVPVPVPVVSMSEDNPEAIDSVEIRYFIADSEGNYSEVQDAAVLDSLEEVRIWLESWGETREEESQTSEAPIPVPLVFDNFENDWSLEDTGDGPTLDRVYIYSEYDGTRARFVVRSDD